MNQIVYILKNESMPEYVKIGFTHGDVKERLKQLDRTGVTLPFEVYYAATVENDKIKINDKVKSLSSFAMELLGYSRLPQGTLYFEYEDEILDDRRRRMDDGEPSEKEIEAAGEAWIQQQADIERGK